MTITPTPIHPPQTAQAGQAMYQRQVTITPITPMIHPPPIVQCGQAMYQTQVTIAPTIQAPYSAQHGQAMYQSATNQIYQSITQPTVMELIYQNPIPHHRQVQMMYLSSSQPMAIQAVYHRETHQQQPHPMYLSSALPKQPMYQSIVPVYTGTQSGYMLATSQPDCYIKPANRNASDNVDIINNDDK